MYPGGCQYVFIRSFKKILQKTEIYALLLQKSNALAYGKFGQQ
jgi:hypothetical protein